MVAQTTLIDDLQRIEAGVINGLTPVLVDMISSVKLHKCIPVLEQCPICKADVIICHHIMSYKNQRIYNGDINGKFDGCIGIAWICPNCHHKIHNINPYFTGVK